MSDTVASSAGVEIAMATTSAKWAAAFNRTSRLSWQAFGVSLLLLFAGVVLPIVVLLLVTANLSQYLDAHPVLALWLAVAFIVLSFSAFAALSVSMLSACGFIVARIRLGYYRSVRNGIAVLLFFAMSALIAIAGVVAFVTSLWREVLSEG